MEAIGPDVEVKIVETQGDQLVVVKRNDLDLNDPDPNNPARQLAYADNLTGWASFSLDPDIVMADIEAGFDFEAIDISLPDLGELLGPAADELLNGDGGNGGEDTAPEIDRAEELRQEWGVESGQLWQLGDHRLICGDCTDEAVVDRVMGGELIPLSVTDPPYNVAQDTMLYAQNQSASLKKLAESEWDRDFDPLLFLQVLDKYLASDGWSYVFTSHHLFGRIFDWMNDAYTKTSFCVWCKPNPMPSLSKVVWTFAVELCLYGRNGKAYFDYPDGSHCLNWWPITKKSDGSHPTQKPIDVLERIIKHCSATRYLVADFFSGSGTTLIACENLNRRCRAIEIDPGYVAVTLQRWADHTGKTPKLLTN